MYTTQRHQLLMPWSQVFNLKMYYLQFHLNKLLSSFWLFCCSVYEVNLLFVCWQILCLEILKELKNLQKVQDHKVIDIWLLVLIYMNCESLHKSVQKLLKKKIVDGYIEEDMFAQCIHGNKDLVQVCILLNAFFFLQNYCLIIELHCHDMLWSCFWLVIALMKDYLPAFLSISEYLLACKEKKATKFGIHMYQSLFEEFVGTYSRQEVSFHCKFFR